MPIPHPGDTVRPPEDGDASHGEAVVFPHGRAAATGGDIPASHVTAGPEVIGLGPQFSPRRGLVAGGAGPGAVSYTHLTLPTIC
eukprot:10963287-Alexandrium_andersonii.AAC.1